MMRSVLLTLVCGLFLAFSPSVSAGDSDDDGEWTPVEGDEEDEDEKDKDKSKSGKTTWKKVEEPMAPPVKKKPVAPPVKKKPVNSRALLRTGGTIVSSALLINGMVSLSKVAASRSELKQQVRSTGDTTSESVWELQQQTNSRLTGGYVSLVIGSAGLTGIVISRPTSAGQGALTVAWSGRW